MKKTMLSTISTLAITALLTGPAFANADVNEIDAKVRSAISHGSLQVSVDENVVTLFGWVENHRSEKAAKQAALSFSGIDRVVDLITVSR